MLEAVRDPDKAPLRTAAARGMTQGRYLKFQTVLGKVNIVRKQAGTPRKGLHRQLSSKKEEPYRLAFLFGRGSRT